MKNNTKNIREKKNSKNKKKTQKHKNTKMDAEEDDAAMARRLQEELDQELALQMQEESYNENTSSRIQNTTRSTGNTNNNFGITSDSPIIVDNDYEGSVDDDEAEELIARNRWDRLREIDEEESENTWEEPVRQPINPRNDILLGDDIGMDDGFAYHHMSVPSIGTGMGMEYGESGVRSRTARRPRGIFNQSTPSIWDEMNEDRALSEITGGDSDMSSHASRLARLFRPPFELIHNVPFDHARVEARDDKKWLLVNIQDNSVFQCQMLNRDLWSDPTLQQLVQANFYFLQVCDVIYSFYFISHLSPLSLFFFFFFFFFLPLFPF